MKSHNIVIICFLVLQTASVSPAESDDVDILSEIQTEMGQWPPEEKDSCLEVLESIKELKNKIPENEFLFLFDSGFYSGLLDYAWGGEKRYNLDSEILKKFQTDLPQKKLPVFTKKLADGALKDLEHSLNPNFIRGVKGAPILMKEKELKVQLVIPFLYQLLTIQDDALTKTLRPAYQFSIYRSALNLKAFASLHGIEIPITLQKLKPDNIEQINQKIENKESDIFQEIDLLTTPNPSQSTPQAEGISTWGPKN